MRKTILFLLGLLMVAACENKAYDTENLTTEVTLLEDEISVPIGNFGPFNLELVKQIPLVNQFLGTVMKTEADGTLLCETSEELYKIGIYEIMAKTKEDMSKPFSYPIGEKYTSPSTLSSMFQGFGFRSVDHHVTLTVNNPLDSPYTLAFLEKWADRIPADSLLDSNLWYDLVGEKAREIERRIMADQCQNLAAK